MKLSIIFSTLVLIFSCQAWSFEATTASISKEVDAEAPQQKQSPKEFCDEDLKMGTSRSDRRFCESIIRDKQQEGREMVKLCVDKTRHFSIRYSVCLSRAATNPDVGLAELSGCLEKSNSGEALKQCLRYVSKKST